MPEFYVTPVAKVRMTQRDKSKTDVRPPVARWRAYAARMKELGAKLQDWDSVLFVLPMPPSWTQKKRLEMCGTPCRSKPDLDNLVGGLMDAVMPEGDSHIAALSSCMKVWGTDGKVVISTPFAEMQAEERRRTERNTALQLSAASASPKQCP